MGYTVCYRSSFDRRSGRELFRDVFSWDDVGRKMEVLDDALVGFSAYYAAVRETNKQTGETRVFAIASKVHLNETEFGYRGDDEFCGPYLTDCPERIFRLLTPLLDGELYAAEWREKVRAKLERKKQARSISAGTKVRFAEPLTFTSGFSADTFIFESGNIFHTLSGNRVRITKWRSRAWEVVGAQNAGLIALPAQQIDLL